MIEHDFAGRAGLRLVTGLRAQHGTFDFAAINSLFDEHLPVVLAGGGDGGGQTILLGLAIIGLSAGAKWSARAGHKTGCRHT